MKNELLSKILPHIVAPILFLIVSYAYFSPLLQGEKIVQHDITMWKGSAKELLDFKETTGREILWTNSMFGGMPTYLISANYSGNLLKWINWILEVGQRPASFIFLTMLGFYILLIVMGVNPWLSITGSLAYGLSTYFFLVIGAGHNAKIHAIAYVAPMIAGVIQAYRGKYWAGFSLFALFFGLNLYTGHPQITYYAGFIILALVIAFLIDAIRDKIAMQFVKATGILAVAAILAFGANFSRLWFTYDYGKDSIRGRSELTSNIEDKTSGLDKSYATQWSYGVAESFNLLIPNLMGGTTPYDIGEDSHTYDFLKENNVPEKQAQAIVSQMPAYWGPQPGTSGPVYLGSIVVFLFVLGLFVVKGSQKWALLIVTLLAVFLAMGHNFMLLTDFFLDYFPGYNKFRTVSMILYIAEFTVPFLAVIALKKVYDNEIDKKEFIFSFKWSSIIVGSIILIFIMFGGVLFNFSSPVDEQYISGGWPEQFIQALRDDRKALLRADAFRSLVFIALAAISLYGFFIKKIKPLYFTILLGLLITIDLWVVNKRYIDNSIFAPEKKAEKPIVPTPADMQILQDKAIDYRVFNLTVSPFNDATTSYFHKSIGGYHGAKLRRYQELIDQHISKGNMAVLNMLNTKYFIQQGEKGPVAHLNPNALGNVWFVDSVRIVQNADQELAALGNFDPAKTAIIDKQFSQFVEGYTSAGDSSSILLAEYQPDRLTYRYNSSTNKLAVFSEIYYPKGWKVTLDGKPADHFRANYILRAMVLPAGVHEVKFTFEPEMFKAGKKVDFASSLAILLIFFSWVGFSLYKFLRKNPSN